MTEKASNPKQALGVKKVNYHVVPAPVIAELSVALLEGACKYGSHNWRVVGVRASTYYDACLRHLNSYWEGEEYDKESGIPHLTKAIACLTVLRDSQMMGNHIDDRPPKSNPVWQTWINVKTEALLEKFPEPKEPFTAK